MGGVKVTRVIHEPGWRWSECVKPAVGTDSCQVGHLIHVTSGRIVVRMDDGSEAEFGPGDVGSIPARELKTPTPRSGRKNGGTHTSCSGFEDGQIQIVNLVHLHLSGDRV